MDEAQPANSAKKRARPTLPSPLAIAVLAAASLAVLLIVPVPIRGRAISSLMDLMHAPAFALLALLVCNAFSQRLPLAFWKKLIVVAVPLFCCGLAAEVAQLLVNRGASWHDARANLLGACAGVCLYELRQVNSPKKRWALVVAVLMLFGRASAGPVLLLGDTWLQQRQFPIFATFENFLEAKRFVPQSAHIQRIQTGSNNKNWALEIELEPGLYPGILLDGMPADWSGYETLAFDVTIDDGPPLDLIVKVHDREHVDHNFADDDRFDGQFRLAPGEHHIRIPLADIRSAPRSRTMNMDEIQGWQLFTYHLEQPRTIVLDNLRLE